MEGDGGIKNIVSKEYPLYFPHPGWSEQKPEDWWAAVLEGLKELTADVDKNSDRRYQLWGQMHGLVTLDANDNVIRPAILWNDGRTQKQTDYLNDVIGKRRSCPSIRRILHLQGLLQSKILWMEEEEPENFAKIVKIMLPKDYLAYKLSGCIVQITQMHPVCCFWITA